LSDTPPEAPTQTEAGAPASPPGPPPAAPHEHSVWARIKQHKIAEWTLAYVAFGFAFLHGVTLLSDALEWPHIIVRSVTLVLIIGAPIVPTLAWYHGVRALRRVSGSEILIIALLLAISGGLLWLIPRPTAERSETASPTTATSAKPENKTEVFNPPAHSIAVLPFVNLSGDKDQEYFSDGLTEELLNSLSEINELQVAARTSSFSFKEHPDIATVAHKLNVGAVLEGSVRRSANTIRITAQLINAVTGFHLWSKTYDRDLGDVLKLQTEIATAVASALKVALLGDEAQKIELGGTRNPAAFDAYLRASKAYQSIRDEQDIPGVIAAYTEAIRLDPNFALAFAGRSFAFAYYAAQGATGAAVREAFEKAESDARQAIALAPKLAEAHAALAYVFRFGLLNFAQAQEEYDRAVMLAPGNAQALRLGGQFAARMGHFAAGISAARRAVVLDPLNGGSHRALGYALLAARQYGEAATAFEASISLDPDNKEAYGYRGLAFYGLGDLERARGSCETKREHWVSHKCLAMAYDKLGRHADAEAEFEKFKAAFGDADAYEYATIYAQWGDRARALEWLDTAVRLRDPGLSNLKTDPLMDPLHNEPRFQVIARQLKFPN
jgi:TolB-like protein/Flp pilus assembly protein TadD